LKFYLLNPCRAVERDGFAANSSRHQGRKDVSRQADFTQRIQRNSAGPQRCPDLALAEPATHPDPEFGQFAARLTRLADPERETCSRNKLSREGTSIEGIRVLARMLGHLDIRGPEATPKFGAHRGKFLDHADLGLVAPAGCQPHFLDFQRDAKCTF
jgi:hypothetical protein